MLIINHDHIVLLLLFSCPSVVRYSFPSLNYHLVFFLSRSIFAHFPFGNCVSFLVSSVQRQHLLSSNDPLIDYWFFENFTHSNPDLDVLLLWVFEAQCEAAVKLVDTGWEKVRRHDGHEMNMAQLL